MLLKCFHNQFTFMSGYSMNTEYIFICIYVRTSMYVHTSMYLNMSMYGYIHCDMAQRSRACQVFIQVWGTVIIGSWRACVCDFLYVNVVYKWCDMFLCYYRYKRCASLFSRNSLRPGVSSLVAEFLEQCVLLVSHPHSSTVWIVLC